MQEVNSVPARSSLDGAHRQRYTVRRFPRGGCAVAAGGDARRDEVVAERDPGAILIGRRAAIPGFAVQLGPMAHLARERARLDGLGYMNAAYEGLSPERKREIEGLVAVHDFLKAFGHQVPKERRTEMRAKYPPVEHPVVRTHPESGLRSIFVNRIFTSHVVGMDRERSTALIDSLCREADYPEYQCRFQWEKDSIAFWDNRTVQHYAASDYWPEVRIMERASIIGERPA
jgi:hypothetical protein